MQTWTKEYNCLTGKQIQLLVYTSMQRTEMPNKNMLNFTTNTFKQFKTKLRSIFRFDCTMRSIFASVMKICNLQNKCDVTSVARLLAQFNFQNNSIFRIHYVVYIKSEKFREENASMENTKPHIAMTHIEFQRHLLLPFNNHYYY